MAKRVKAGVFRLHRPACPSSSACGLPLSSRAGTVMPAATCAGINAAIDDVRQSTHLARAVGEHEIAVALRARSFHSLSVLATNLPERDHALARG